MDAPPPLHGLTLAQVSEFARRQLPRGAGAARALYGQWMKTGAFDPAACGLGALAQAAWMQAFSCDLPAVSRVLREEREGDYGPVVTAKAVLKLADGAAVECVHIPRGRGRFSLCISSQVGCKMACGFCETGRMGLRRQLSADEMVAQVLVARHRLGWQVDNVVFMGMGEALDNAPALLACLAILADPAGCGIPLQRMTVCTVGHVPGIRALAAAGLTRLGLAVSLNAARDELRSQLMPINRRWPLQELQTALREYRPRPNFQLAVHYCLMPGMNDAPEDVDAIADFVRPLGRAMVNLIPYNPGSISLTRPPRDEEVSAFASALRAQGLMVRKRITKGASVMAACGQLSTRGV
ncbi:MAG: radical SAM protein [Planctomycetota bacterium]|nr:MAG: radical SAM protein [Planctomycetota bacterium]